MPVIDETQYPANRIVRIETVLPNGSTVTGTGVLTGAQNDEVLTGADLVWQSGVGAATSVLVDPKINGAHSYGEIQVDHYRFFPIASHGSAGDQFDFALLHLATPFADPNRQQFPIDQSAGLSSALNASGSARGSIYGYPTSEGGATIDFVNVAAVTTSSTSTAHYIETSAPTDPGYVGAGMWFAPRATPNGPSPVGVETADGQIAELTRPLVQLMNSWMAADQSGAAQPSGAIAVPLPLTQTITPDIGAPGIDPSEARLVDKASYLLNRPDVAAADVDPAVHFATNGWHEATPPDALFDVKYYLQHNPDVAAAGVDPLLHYALYGWHEGRDPSAGFSTSTYLATYPDVALAGIDPLEHYLWFGIAENRAVAPGKA